MKKGIQLLLVICSLSVLILYSCNKDTKEDPKSVTPKTNHDLLLGKWTIVREGGDGNDNGKLDAEELIYRNKDLHYIFNADGTAAAIYNYSGKEEYTSYTWMVEEDKLFLMILGKADTIKYPYTIETLTETDLTLRRDVDKYTIFWYLFVKG